MLKIADVRQWISSLGIAEDEHVYIGKLDNKQQKSIGLYPRAASGVPEIALGGLDCTTHATYRASMLVHWTKKISESEEAAHKLFMALQEVTDLTIGGVHIDYLRLAVPEPQYVGTDDASVHEYVIWLDFIYQRKG